MRLPACLSLLLAVPVALANVEKTVFLAPSAITIPNARPGLQDLRLSRLSPENHILRTHLPVSFPSEAEPRGLQSWYLLDTLREGQRYEVRICWPATQPTNFWLDVYPITEVFDTPELISALASYSESRQDNTAPEESTATTNSLLFLQIQAAADFFSTNKSLMSSPPDVHVDIILDPYLLNILPRSLAPTAAYITILAVGAWFLSSFVCRWVSVIEAPKAHTD